MKALVEQALDVLRREIDEITRQRDEAVKLARRLDHENNELADEREALRRELDEIKKGRTAA